MRFDVCGYCALSDFGLIRPRIEPCLAEPKFLVLSIQRR